MHTPGPWKIYEGMDASDILAYGWALVVHHADAGKIVANVNVKGGPTYTEKMPTLANAHLIAAAPDLLEALEGAYQTLRNMDSRTIMDEGAREHHVCNLSDVRAAIAKARGR